MTDQKEFKKLTQTTKNEHTAGCLSFQVKCRSKRYYDIFRMGKIAKSSFLDKGYYENEGFSLEMNITCSTQNKLLFHSCYWWRQNGLTEMFKYGKFFLTKKKMVKKEYYENEDFSLARDRSKAFKSAENRMKMCKII